MFLVVLYMPKSASSHKWLQEHASDKFVKQAKQAGWRSRASYKLLEIQQKYKIFKPNYSVIDLGAAPGGWSQVASKFIGAKGKVISSDILAMDPICGVEFIRGDFTEDKVITDILNTLNNNKVDLVISDMAPNMSGIKDLDQLKAMHLVELALDFTTQILKPGGCFLIKVFQGCGYREFLLQLKQLFKKVITSKPEASRSRSNEIYLLAQIYTPII
jgi:23S rRNA (uridine2552-2'-O)-methyltransferase